MLKNSPERESVENLTLPNWAIGQLPSINNSTNLKDWSIDQLTINPLKNLTLPNWAIDQLLCINNSTNLNDWSIDQLTIK